MAGYAGYDMAAAIVMILFAVLGLAGGMLRQLVRLAAVILGGWAGLVWGPILIRRLGLSFDHGTALIVPLIVFLLTYLGIVIAGMVIVRIIRATSPATGVIDRILGLILGAIKGAALVYMVTAIIIFAAGKGRIRGMGTHNSMTYNWVKAHPITTENMIDMEKNIRVKVIHVIKTGKEKVQEAATGLKKDTGQKKDAIQKKDVGKSRKADK